MRFFKYQPEVSGDYGENTIYSGPGSVDVVKMHYEFCYWPQDDMLWCGFDFVGTDRLKAALEAMHPPVTGIEFAPVEISGDDQEFERVWREERPLSALGKWHWFKITGRPGVQDFGQNYHSIDLVISERVVAVLLERMTVINPARKIRPWEGEIVPAEVPQKGAPAAGES